MRRYVSTWEELPEGVWLDNDEYGVHWYQANDGTYWHSTDDGYRVWEEVVKERQMPIVQPSASKPQKNFAEDYFSEYDFDEDDYDDDDDDYQSGSFRRRKFPFFTVAIALIILGGGGAAGYFIYGYFNKTPMEEFYGTTYWGYTDGELYGYLFEDKNSFDMILAADDEGCDSGSERYENSDFLCIYDYAELAGDYDMDFSLVEKSDHFEMCIANECADFYPIERGLVLNADPEDDEDEDEDECVVLVSDIGNPTFVYYDDGDIASYVLSESWKLKYQEIVDDLENDFPSSC